MSDIPWYGDGAAPLVHFNNIDRHEVTKYLDVDDAIKCFAVAPEQILNMFEYDAPLVYGN